MYTNEGTNAESNETDETSLVEKRSISTKDYRLVSYGNLLKKLVSRAFNDWLLYCRRAATEDPRSAPFLRAALMQYCRHTREMFLKVALLQRLLVYQKPIHSLIQGVISLQQRKIDLHSLMALDLWMTRQETIPYQIPPSNIEVAIDVLATGTYPRLPVLMEKLVKSSHGFLFPDIPAEERIFLRQRLEDELLLHYIHSKCPKDKTAIALKNGKINLYVEDEFSLVIIADFTKWQVLDCNILFVKRMGLGCTVELKITFLALLSQLLILLEEKKRWKASKEMLERREKERIHPEEIPLSLSSPMAISLPPLSSPTPEAMFCSYVSEDPLYALYEVSHRFCGCMLMDFLKEQSLKMLANIQMVLDVHYYSCFLPSDPIEWKTFYPPSSWPKQSIASSTAVESSAFIFLEISILPRFDYALGGLSSSSTPSPDFSSEAESASPKLFFRFNKQKGSISVYCTPLHEWMTESKISLSSTLPPLDPSLRYALERLKIHRGWIYITEWHPSKLFLHEWLRYTICALEALQLYRLFFIFMQQPERDPSLSVTPAFSSSLSPLDSSFLAPTQMQMAEPARPHHCSFRTASSVSSSRRGVRTGSPTSPSLPPKRANPPPCLFRHLRCIYFGHTCDLSMDYRRGVLLIDCQWLPLSLQANLRHALTHLNESIFSVLAVVKSCAFHLHINTGLQPFGLEAIYPSPSSPLMKWSPPLSVSSMRLPQEEAGGTLSTESPPLFKNNSLLSKKKSDVLIKFQNLEIHPVYGMISFGFFRYRSSVRTPFSTAAIIALVYHRYSILHSFLLYPRGGNRAYRTPQSALSPPPPSSLFYSPLFATTRLQTSYDDPQNAIGLSLLLKHPPVNLCASQNVDSFSPVDSSFESLPLIACMTFSTFVDCLLKGLEGWWESLADAFAFVAEDDPSSFPFVSLHSLPRPETPFLHPFTAERWAEEEIPPPSPASTASLPPPPASSTFLSPYARAIDLRSIFAASLSPPFCGEDPPKASDEESPPVCLKKESSSPHRPLELFFCVKNTDLPFFLPMDKLLEFSPTFPSFQETLQKGLKLPSQEKKTLPPSLYSLHTAAPSILQWQTLKLDGYSYVLASVVFPPPGDSIFPTSPLSDSLFPILRLASPWCGLPPFKWPEAGIHIEALPCLRRPSTPS
ncbi:mediator complex subunit MED14 [Cardiosporidium cionae]|uniref:Mediator of RNA polymerase II transcription subunit 14 n=1 Tax=Cardiosporidium cionae TaxID=476202 RepID=A0ABQ7J511_9APIC|nr:mediator complex subunit MED14 [Cardiosporidium cionae]|eukprot:KAF8819067.1 mediator complex subunit MED14 [Cardiosporidium cionae]